MPGDPRARAEAAGPYRPQPLERFVEGAATREKIDFARDQRREGSKAEKTLWEHLRARRLGYKFRRQHPIGDFVLDFFCHEAKLAVEIDGEQHAEQATYDQWRNEGLGRWASARCGYRRAKLRGTFSACWGISAKPVGGV